MKFGIGQPMRRHEDLHLITGRGRYTDDVILPRMTHAFVLQIPKEMLRLITPNVGGAFGTPQSAIAVRKHLKRASGRTLSVVMPRAIGVSPNPCAVATQLSAERGVRCAPAPAGYRNRKLTTATSSKRWHAG
jgi:carbon-monoxide dehydrogenase large subunit